MKFYMLVGIPGSGKTYYSKEHIGELFDEVFSSDEYRQKLLGNENSQEDNSLVFHTMNEDCIKALQTGKSVCYDATNVTRKSRRGILSLIEQNKIECEKIAVVFIVSPQICYKRNEERERTVPKEVINKFIRRFELPMLGEGFDNIELIEVPSENPKPYGELLLDMIGFDQGNPHHRLDLFTHCADCSSELRSILDRSQLDDNQELLMASLLHDFGKLYTKRYNEEKDICQYIGHENLGAYCSFFLDLGPLELDRYKLAFYINYHMEPYRLRDAKHTTLEKYKKMFGDEWNNIMLLHVADEEAH